jgi:hypothetical protein
MTVMDFAEVIKRARLFGVRQGIGTTIVRDGKEAFFDIDIGGAVFTHGA